jgi:hypothetical protein
MEPLSVRFEQKRGHFMIVERFPPVTRDELNETQLQMLKTCDIPGLLPLETEECDGQLSLRYSLSGTRMLSEALRTTNWSMIEMMGALCRLAEVLEECRLYLLDADRIRLHDEFIFVGDEWHDLKFTYIPIDMPTLRKADDLERLIIRWIMKVKEPDGKAMQAILRLVATAGFMPITLSRYARQYLAGSLKDKSLLSSHPPAPELFAKPVESGPVPAKSSRPWDLIGPPSGDPHSFSQMLGDDSAPPRHIRIPMEGARQTEADTDPNGTSMDIGRWRIIVACLGLMLLAVGWRFLYLDQPNQQALLFCLFLTLVIGAGILLMWNGLPEWASRRYRVQTPDRGLRSEVAFGHRMEDEEIDSEEWGGSPRFAISLSPPHNEPLFMSDNSAAQPATDEGGRSAFLSETSWIPSHRPDQTALLNHKLISHTEACYLDWESRGASSRIPLRGDSLVIGRSAEAAQHVDDTAGISRAHAELVRISEQWKVKDLGSRNGSLLNDKPMAPYELYVLQEGDRLTLSDSQYRFHQSI